MKLRLADNLSLPLDAVTQTFGILSVRGARAIIRLYVSRSWIPAVESLVAAVVRLLLRGGPPAILRGISLGIVLSIDRMAGRRSRSHISIERFEAVPPSVAYGDSSSAIVRIIQAIRIVTARLNSRPCLIFTRMSHAVRCGSFGRSFSLETSARLDFLTKVVLTNLRDIFTLTAASPDPMLSLPRQFFKDYKSTKLPSTKILITFECVHNGHYSTNCPMVGNLAWS